MSRRARVLDTPTGRIAYTLAHRPRVTRRLHLELDADGGLVVVTPRDWPEGHTRRLLNANAARVERFLVRARERRLPPLDWTDGGRHLYRGEALTLRLTPRRQRGARLERDGDLLRVALSDPSPDAVRGAVTRWYAAQAQRRFRQRLTALQRRTAWARDRELTLRLRRMRRTWGTCSSRGVVRLNTHLVKAPDLILDYVIAHELCHLREMNHGPRFYALQERLWPEWRQHRRHLREHGARYVQE